VQWKEIKRKYEKAKKRKLDVNSYRRLLVLHMRGLGKTNKEISEAVGFSPYYVTELVGKYIKHGLDAILEDKRTSNNRRMDFNEEATFLAQFVELANEGLIVTVEKILQKFEEKTGKPSNTSTIYKLLKRHGWRKVKPRPRHPGAASDEEIAVSKKLSKISERSNWKKIEETSETSTKNTSACG